ncbi:MAG: hypothetical protein GY815_05415 [Gammaproteobacteria bacterium]|nr:hypothetical protein [Gammaproteobacteria bacterium]
MTDEIFVHSFIVTIRWDFSKTDSSQSEWRGTILDVDSGKVVHFRHFDDLKNAWRKITKNIAAPNAEKAGSKTQRD